MMVPQLLICIFISIGISLVSANVEKTIFLGPEPINIPQQHPNLSDLNIDLLTPETWSLRTHVEAIFPTKDLEKGKPTWLILDNLTEGQRYEQPTEFHLKTYPLPTVFETPELITSLYDYSMSRQPPPPSSPPPTTDDEESILSPKGADDAPPSGERQSSILFLRIEAAADYFTTNQTLMEHPEPVVADIILDPFVFNVLPRTLVPTVGYIVFIAALSWVLSTRLVMPWVRGLMVGDDSVAEQERKTQ